MKAGRCGLIRMQAAMNTDDQLDDEPATVLRFQPDVQRAQILFPVSIIFMLIGAHMLQLGKLEGLYLVLLFGVSAVFMFVQMLPTCGYLEIDASGFTVCSQFRIRRFEWSEIREFGLIHIGPYDVVGINFHPSFRGKDRTTGVLRDMHDYEAGLPNCYGMTGPELLALLTKCKSAGAIPATDAK